MPKKQPQLAKLTRPRLHKAVTRERLFALLDEAREHKPSICVVGPPGAGKTTLAASWLDDRGIEGIWYQVDSGDADLATFFYYLGEAAKAFTRKGRRSLPVLNPEYLQDVEGFSRRFFRELFTRLPEGAAVVLDNYQEIAAELAFHRLIAQAVDELPAGAVLLLLTRYGPPDSYSRLIANGRIQFLDWDVLRFTLEEAEELQSASPGVSAEHFRRVYDVSDGWAAGLTLLLADSRGTGLASVRGSVGRDALFNYFAEQTFEQVPDSTRAFLATTAILSQVPVSLAIELTGNADAGRILEDLYLRHLFTHQRSGSEPVYWYHALFREFLLERAPVLLGLDGYHGATRRAAVAVEARGEVEEAFRLYSDAGEWGAAARIAQLAAESLLAGGRGRILRDWILALPAQFLDEKPMLRYLLGLSLLQTDPREARQHLEVAAADFPGELNITDHTLTVAAIIDSYFYEWADFRPVREWVDKLESLIDRVQIELRRDVTRKLNTSLLTGMIYGYPEHSGLPRIVNRMSDHLDDAMDVNSRISMAVILLSYCNIACDMTIGRRVVSRCTALTDAAELTPLNRMWWHLRVGYHYELCGHYSAARAHLDKAVGFCETHGFRGLRGAYLLIASYQLSTAAAGGGHVEARRWYERMVSYSSPLRPMDVWHVDEARVHLEILNGNYRLVAELSERAISRTAEAGMLYAEILTVVNWGIGRAVIGDAESLESALAKLRILITGTCFSHFYCVSELLEVYFSLKHGDRKTAAVQLAQGMRSTRSREFEFPQTLRFSVMAGELFAEALRIGCEADYVLDMVRKLRIRAPESAPYSWPWPVRVRTMGGLEIDCAGVCLDFQGKAPRKLLSLLKCLIVHGGRKVPEYRVRDALWPGEPADLAAKALDVALVRLRKLLGHQHAIITGDETLSLNPDVVWTDVWAFEQAEERETRAIDDDLAANARQEAMDLYRGEFLPSDAAVSWALMQRERLRNRFLRLVARAAERYEHQKNWEAAILCYERGLSADNLAEPFYQGLMRCYRALGRYVEGVGTYRRLRHMLSVLLGMAPSESTQALARALQAESPAQPL